MEMTTDSLSLSQTNGLEQTANGGVSMDVQDLVTPNLPPSDESPNKENSKSYDLNLSPNHTLRRSQGLTHTRNTTPGRSTVFPSMTLSEQATQRRLEKERNLQVETLQRQMDILEQKNIEQAKSRRKLTQELDQKNREVKFYEKQVYDLQSENQHLKHQLESTIRVSSGVASLSTSTGVVGTLTGTKRGATNQLTRQQDAIMTREAALVQELRLQKDKYQQLETSQQELKDQNGELALQVKILQDALAFRSEEIGLAGHSDLLAKVAKLKGEVMALKTELTHKCEELSHAKEDKQQLATQREHLQEEIAAIQQRLAQAQQETYKYATHDVASLLKATEQERDLLIEYIQNDMEKSTKLAKQVEELEGEIRQQRKKGAMLEEKLEDRKAQYDHIQSQSKYYEDEFHKYHDKYQEAAKLLDKITAERESYGNQLQRKQQEEEDLIQNQVTLFSQLQAKDAELLHKSEELIKCKTKLQELDVKCPLLEAEVHKLRQRNAALESENHTLKSKVNHDLEPKVKHNEGLVSKLTKEVEELRKEKLQSQVEIQQLQVIKDAMENVLQDLERVDQHHIDKDTDKTSAKKTNKKHQSSPISTENVVNIAVGDINPTLSLSQQHALWIGLPSLRNLCLPLYDRIRQLAHDLYTTEQYYQQLQSRHQQLDTEHDQLQHGLQDKLQYFQQQHAHDQELILQITEKLHLLEQESYQLKDATHILQQIKLVLQAYPGQKPLALQQQIHEHGHFEINDSMLPELINDALLTNSQAVLTVQEITSQNQILLTEREDLQGKVKLANMKNDDLERSLRDYMERVSQYEKKCVDMERDCSSQIDDAAELAEKQNALMMTLEAKIEGLQRDRQVRIAQIQALHQREETMKARIISFCDREHYPLPASIASSTASSSLGDLINYVLERYCLKTVGRSTPTNVNMYPNANVAGVNPNPPTTTRPQPSYHQHDNHHSDLPHRQRSISPTNQGTHGYQNPHNNADFLRPIHSTRLSSTQASGYQPRDDPTTLLRDSYSQPSNQIQQDRLRRSQGGFQGTREY